MTQSYCSLRELISVWSLCFYYLGSESEGLNCCYSSSHGLLKEWFEKDVQFFTRESTFWPVFNMNRALNVFCAIGILGLFILYDWYCFEEASGYLTNRLGSYFLIEKRASLSEVFERRRQILLRACAVVGDLNAFASNGTSFEDLIAIHRRVHNLNDPLWPVENICHPATQEEGRRFVIYELNKGINDSRYASDFSFFKRAFQTGYKIIFIFVSI